MESVKKIYVHDHGTMVIFTNGTRVCSCSPRPIFAVRDIPSLR